MWWPHQWRTKTGSSCYYCLQKSGQKIRKRPIDRRTESSQLDPRFVARGLKQLECRYISCRFSISSIKLGEVNNKGMSVCVCMRCVNDKVLVLSVLDGQTAAFRTNSSIFSIFERTTWSVRGPFGRDPRFLFRVIYLYLIIKLTICLDVYIVSSVAVVVACEISPGDVIMECW